MMQAIRVRATASLVSRLGLMIGVLLGGACRSRPAGPWTAADVRGMHRVITVTRWDTIGVYGGGADTTLADLWLIAADSQVVYIYDNADQRLLALSPSLELRWRFGGKGSGPGEFTMVRSLAIAPAGDAVLYDAGLGRVTTVTRDGSLGGSLRITGRAEQVAPAGPGRYIEFNPDGKNSPVLQVDSLGHEPSEVPLAWPGYAQMNPLVRGGGLLQGDPASGRWLLALTDGNGWFGFRGARALPFVGKYVEHTEFPNLVVRKDGRFLESTGHSAQGVAIADSTVAFLFAGLGDSAYRLVDRYRFEDGRYLGTLLLPRPVNGLAVADGDYFVVFNNPAPAVMRLRPVPPPR